jgi:hypothetical protein
MRAAARNGRLVWLFGVHANPEPNGRRLARRASKWPVRAEAARPHGIPPRDTEKQSLGQIASRNVSVDGRGCMQRRCVP